MEGRHALLELSSRNKELRKKSKEIKKECSKKSVDQLKRRRAETKKTHSKNVKDLQKEKKILEDRVHILEIIEDEKKFKKMFSTERREKTNVKIAAKKLRKKVKKLKTDLQEAKNFIAQQDIEIQQLKDIAQWWANIYELGKGEVGNNKE